MTIREGLRIVLLALVVALMSRYGYLEFRSWREDRVTVDLCHAVSNYLEVGNVREAYENLLVGVQRSGFALACVGVIDNDRNYSPNCIDPATSYHATVCRAIGNQGVRAQILYPRSALWGGALLIVWGLVSLALILFSILSRSIASYLARQVTEELQKRIFSQETSNPVGLARRMVEATLEKTGILRTVRMQAARFEARLREFEERERSAAILQARSEAESKRSKEYIAMVSQIRHDIHSPLSTLQAIRADLATDDLIQSSLATSISTIEQLIERLGNSSENERPRLTIAEVITEQTVGPIRLRFQKTKDVSLSLKYNFDRLSPIEVAPLGFQRVLNNLLENAFDSVSIGGSIQVIIDSDGSYCRIRVEDDGCGVPLDVLGKLFEKGATFGKVNGGGQGLQFVKKSVEAWHGRVVCEPLERGTRFEIFLPLLQTGTVFTAQPPTNQLVVLDDDPTLARALEASGFEILDVALDGSEAKQLLRVYREDYHATILVDESLGDGTHGTDLIREVGASHNIFLCTNDFDNPEVIRRARAIGVQIIPKPLCRQARPRQDVAMASVPM